ncbi:MAG: DUF167 domain-containing protein [Candidatus Hermodarchaeota archaeon]
MTVKVKPSSKKQQISVEEDGSLLIHLKSVPLKGKANKELLQLLKETFGTPVTLISGKTSSTKRIEVDLSLEELKEILKKN